MKFITIDEVATVVRGSSPRPQGDVRYYGGNVPRLMVSDVTRDGMYVTPKIDFLTEEGATKSRPMKKGDFIIAVSGDPGEPCILTVDACIHDGFVGFRNLDLSKVFTPYLYRFFKYNKLKSKSQAVGAIYKNLNTDQIKGIQIPLPTLPQQQKIANILDAADALRQNDKALIAKYDELTQALFLDMFGDYLNSKLYPLKDLVRFSQGQQFGVEQQLLEPKEGYARFLRIVDYTQGEDLRFVPNNSKNYYVSKEDIVIVRYGASAGFVGTNKEGVLANNLFKVNYDKQMYNQAFLYFIFQNDRFKKFVNKEAFGAAMPALSFKVMERFEIPVPPLDLQNQFAERVAVIEEQKAIAQKSLEKSESLFNSLLQKAFKGELV